MKQNNTNINYYACIGLFDFIERGISFNKNIYDLTDDEINNINYMYCRNLETEEDIYIRQSVIKDTLNNSNVYIVNKPNGFYSCVEFYLLSSIFMDIKKEKKDDLFIRKTLEEVTRELDHEKSKTKSKKIK